MNPIITNPIPIYYPPNESNTPPSQRTVYDSDSKKEEKEVSTR